jgi:hypothetical protein
MPLVLFLSYFKCPGLLPVLLLIFMVLCASPATNARGLVYACPATNAPGLSWLPILLTIPLFFNLSFSKCPWSYVPVLLKWPVLVPFCAKRPLSFACPAIKTLVLCLSCSKCPCYWAFLSHSKCPWSCVPILT